MLALQGLILAVNSDEIERSITIQDSHSIIQQLPGYTASYNNRKIESKKLRGRRWKTFYDHVGFENTLQVL